MSENYGRNLRTRYLPGSLFLYFLLLVVCGPPLLAQEATPRTFIPEKPDPYAVQLCPDEDEHFRQDLYAASYRIPDQKAQKALNSADEGQFIATDSRQLSDGTTLTLWQTRPSGSGRYFDAKVTVSSRQEPVWHAEDLLDGGVKLREEANRVLLVTAHRAGERLCNPCEDRYIISSYRWNPHVEQFQQVDRYLSRGKYYQWGNWFPAHQPPPLPKCGTAVALALFPSPAAACACCVDPGTWYHDTARLTPEQLSEVGRIRLSRVARLFLTPAGLEAVKGIAAPRSTYILDHVRPGRSWTLEFREAESVSAGALRFTIPARARFFASAAAVGRTSPDGLDVYKEWRFEGPVTGTGVFAAGVAAGAVYSLVLQGRGNACPNASHFSTWVLRVTGSRAAFTLFGALDAPDRRLGAEPDASYFATPEDAVDKTTKLLRAEEWRELARHYDLSQSGVHREELTSGRFFLNAQRPEIAHPGLPWRYRHPFAPGFTFRESVATSDPTVVRVTLGIAIDQGDGRIQRGVSDFLLRKSAAGYQILPPAPRPQ